jgi:signal transduction histidine kinase
VDVVAPSPEPRLAPDLELALYRVVQEALSNVLRHGEAELARVSFAATDRMLEIHIVDSGRGFDPETVEREARGMGLLGMRERARNAGGELEIDSAPGTGTRVTVRLPMEVRGG